MRMHSWVILLSMALLPAIATAEDAAIAESVGDGRGIINPAIDMDAFLRISMEAAEHRQARRISEAEFLRMSREPGTVVLDARSAEKYRLLHVKGAINLSFPDIGIESLAQTLPDKDTRILIYCNNNFAGAERPFPSKLASASLNLSTFVALYDYGYRNVYELAPLIELGESELEFVTDEAQDDRATSLRSENAPVGRGVLPS